MKSKGLLLQLLAANGGRIAAGDIQKALIELRDQGLVVEDFTHKGAPKYITHHITYDWTLTDDGRKYIKNVEGLVNREKRREGITGVKADMIYFEETKGDE